MLVERVARHTAFKWGSVALLPVSLAMGILPGPSAYLVTLYTAHTLRTHSPARRQTCSLRGI